MNLSLIYPIPFHFIIFHFITFYSIPFHSIPSYSIPFHFILFHFILFFSILGLREVIGLFLPLSITSPPWKPKCKANSFLSYLLSSAGYIPCFHSSSCVTHLLGLIQTWLHYSCIIYLKTNLNWLSINLSLSQTTGVQLFITLLCSNLDVIIIY